MRINNFNDLQCAAKGKKAVYCPSGKHVSFTKPIPAAVVQNMTAAVVQKAINTGLYVYIKEERRPVFFNSTKRGALMCDRYIPYLTEELNDKDRILMGGRYYVCFMKSEQAMKTLVKALNGVWKDAK